MAKNDYHVIVYQILAYLYAQLKKGKPIEPEMISNDSWLLEINYDYWLYIMKSLLELEYISGIQIQEIDGSGKVRYLNKCQITPKGIEYICDDKMIEKVRNYVCDKKDIPTNVDLML